MGKRKINAKELVEDLKSGLAQKDLLAKYNVSGDGLKTLLKKLMDAGMLTQDDLRARKQAQAGRKASTGQSNPPPARAAVPQTQTPQEPTPQTVDKETALAIAEQIKQGDHDNSIMSKFELTPGKLKAIKQELSELGYLPKPESESVVSGHAPRLVCPSCGVDADPGDQTCVYCGAAIDRPPERPMPTHGFRDQSAQSYSDEDDDEDEKACPWEERDSYGTLNAYVQTGTNSLLNPVYFFSRLPTDTGYGNPILFSIFSALVGTVFAYIWTSLYYGSGGLFFFLISIVFVLAGASIAIPLFLFIWGGMIHLALVVVGGANSGYQATFRSVAYSSVTQVFNAIPIIGNIAGLYGLFLTAIGIRETHKTSTGKSALAVIIPLLVMILILVGVYFKAKQMIFSALMGQAGINQEYSIGPSDSSLSGPLPDDLCLAFDNFIMEVDMAMESADPDEAKKQMGEAVNDLALAAQPYKNDSDVLRFINLASFYVAMRSAELQGHSAATSMGSDAREALLEMCAQ